MIWMKIRYSFIRKRIVAFLKSVPQELLVYPLNMKQLVKCLPNIRICTYETYAQRYQIQIREVYQICQSKSGCTIYNPSVGKYLLLYNNASYDNNVSGRRQWTLAHELGHILLNHLAHASNSVPENDAQQAFNKLLESEADEFSATILAPFPLFQQLSIKSSLDVKRVFGLSDLASVNRYSSYIKWKRAHVKTSFDDDMVKLFRNFIAHSVA